jgi:hypothetical protein
MEVMKPRYMLSLIGDKPRFKRAATHVEPTGKFVAASSPQGILEARLHRKWWRQRDLNILRQFVAWQEQECIRKQMDAQGYATGGSSLMLVRVDPAMVPLFRRASRGA